MQIDAFSLLNSVFPEGCLCSVTVAVGWLHAEGKLVSFLVLQCFNFILSSNSPPTLIIFELFHQSVLTTAHYTFNIGLFPSISQISCCLIYEDIRISFKSAVSDLVDVL